MDCMFGAKDALMADTCSIYSIGSWNEETVQPVDTYVNTNEEKLIFYLISFSLIS